MSERKLLAPPGFDIEAIQARSIIHRAEEILAIDPQSVANAAELEDLQSAREIAQEAARKAQAIIDRRNAIEAEAQAKRAAEEAAVIEAQAKVKALADRERELQQEQARLAKLAESQRLQAEMADALSASLSDAVNSYEDAKLSEKQGVDVRERAATFLAQTLRIPVLPADHWVKHENLSASVDQFGCRFNVTFEANRTYGEDTAWVLVSHPAGNVQLPGSGNFTVKSYREWTQKLAQNAALLAYLSESLFDLYVSTESESA